MALLIAAVIIAKLVVAMFRFFRLKVPEGFDKVKDLVRGTIIVPAN